jgi:hypothetical protein
MRSLVRFSALLLAVTFATISVGNALEPPLVKRLGCFKDTAVHDLDGYRERAARNSPVYCASLCKGKGFRYGAVQNGEMCLCGNSYGKYGPAENCDVKRTGDSVTCGGGSTNEVFERVN